MGDTPFGSMDVGQEGQFYTDETTDGKDKQEALEDAYPELDNQDGA